MAIQTIIYHNHAFYPIFSEQFQSNIPAKLRSNSRTGFKDDCFFLYLMAMLVDRSDQNESIIEDPTDNR
jgi:hypothetical protein